MPYEDMPYEDMPYEDMPYEDMPYEDMPYEDIERLFGCGLCRMYANVCSIMDAEIHRLLCGVNMQ